MTGRELTSTDRSNAQNESKDINWEALPEAILAQLDKLDYIQDSEKEIQAIDVYASITRDNSNAKAELETWLDEELDPLAGFQVHIFARRKDQSKHHCSNCNAALERSELVKGLNTKVACDMLSHAVDNSYDIGVLMMGDDELAPSILCVQEIFDKQIVHVGANNEGNGIRSAAWGNFCLEDLMPDIVSQEDFKKQYDKARRRPRVQNH
jgi:hypothetical protein